MICSKWDQLKERSHFLFFVLSYNYVSYYGIILLWVYYYDIVFLLSTFLYKDIELSWLGQYQNKCLVSSFLIEKVTSINTLDIFYQKISAALLKPNVRHPDNTPKQFLIELFFCSFKTHKGNFSLLALNYHFQINLNFAFQWYHISMTTDLKMLKIGYFRSMSFKFCLLNRVIEVMTDKVFSSLSLVPIPNICQTICQTMCQTMSKIRVYFKQFFRSYRSKIPNLLS